MHAKITIVGNLLELRCSVLTISSQSLLPYLCYVRNCNFERAREFL